MVARPNRSQPRTPTPAARSPFSRASRRCASAPACTSAPPASAACTTWCGRSSTTPSTRRWPGYCDTRPRHPAGRRRRPGRGQRPWHPGRHAPGREAAHRRGVMTVLHAGGKFDGKSYARLRWSARRRRHRRQRAVEAARRPHLARRHRVAPGATTWPSPARWRRSARRRSSGTEITFWADDDIFETTTYSFDTISRRLQEMAFLNKGLTIVLRDERPGHSKAETGLAEEISLAEAAPQAGAEDEAFEADRDHLPLRRRSRGLRQAHQRQEVARSTSPSSASPPTASARTTWR